MAKKTKNAKKNKNLKRPSTSKSQEAPKQKKGKVHPWRPCPEGEHWVRTHPLTVPPNKTFPDGYLTERREHCARNPSGKDQLYRDEILAIAAQKEFLTVKNRPCRDDLAFKNDGDKYDELIAGWVKYWNDIFEPKDPLDPNVVNALIASESRFKPSLLADKKNQNSARGLMQITNASRKILGDEKGELKEHFLTVTRSDLNDPGINIAAGVRWLFHKRKLASSKAKKDVPWDDVIYKYKGCDTVTPKRAKELMKRYTELLEKLKKCQKK